MNNIDESVIRACWNKSVFDSFHLNDEAYDAEKDPIDGEITELAGLLKGNN